ncbi:hypothetical protein SAMN05443572_104186 [Myxococcus fulvus]|uniref:DUF7919 domain-containing protein n=1 Tax=Myxococcus fulvus TaxID=33 RepID=A0A511SZ70_MYXFU|nr:hypothetical protein [Myxococcus fulvus]GEN07190.1 hypothetical protein MFU01_22270 [Myxococcus fulvus]SET98217.1 hypothetical protein SAMN05443572_104186 [Myxococcus fulvus]
MHVFDLEPISLPGLESPKLRAVGWIERGFDHPKGDVTPEFMKALVGLLVDPWQPVTYAGIHRCTLCRFSGGPGQLTFEEQRVTLGVANLYVPGEEGVVYVAPSSVVHYIDAHEYVPPDEFQRAVLSCPPMRSMAYLKRVMGLRTTA